MAEVAATVDVYESALQPDAPRFFHEIIDGPVALLGIHRNRVDLDIAQACVPVTGQVDVEAFVVELALQLRYLAFESTRLCRYWYAAARNA